MKRGPDYGKELKPPFSVGGNSSEHGQVCGNEKENKKKHAAKNLTWLIYTQRTGAVWK